MPGIGWVDTPPTGLLPVRGIASPQRSPLPWIPARPLIDVSTTAPRFSFPIAEGPLRWSRPAGRWRFASEQAQRRGACLGAGNGQQRRIPRRRAEADRACARRSGRVRGLRIDVLSHPERRRTDDPPRAVQACCGAAARTHGYGAVPGLELGHHLPAQPDPGPVLLPLPHRGRVQSQRRGRRGSTPTRTWSSPPHSWPTLDNSLCTPTTARR